MFSYVSCCLREVAYKAMLLFYGGGTFRVPRPLKDRRKQVANEQSSKSNGNTR